MQSRYKSNSNQVLKNAEKQIMRNMKIACEFAVNYAKRSVSRPNPTGRDPSQPGEPPKKVKGILRSHIGYEVRKEGTHIRGFVGVKQGVAGDYGYYLELGTSKMAARPFLRPTILNNRKKIGRIITKGR